MHAAALGPVEVCEHASRQLHEIKLEVGEVRMNLAPGYSIRRNMMTIAPDTITELFGEYLALVDVVDETVAVSLEKRKIACVAHY